MSFTFTHNLKNRADMVRSICRIGVFVLVLAFQNSGQEPAKTFLVDEFSNPNCEDVWARLDNFLVQMNYNPAAIGTVSIAAGRADIRGNLYIESMVRNYFLSHKLPQDRWRIIRSGPNEDRLIRFWITPPGGQPPNIDPTTWSLEYPPETKPFIFTNGESTIGGNDCIYVDELSLLAGVLDANPRAATNVVLMVQTDKEFDRRKKRILKQLVHDYALNNKRIRFFKRIDRKPNPHGIRPDIEYWFVP